MLALLRRLLNYFVVESGTYRKILYRRRFPGLSVSEAARLEIVGHFSYGLGSAISQGARIFVKEGSTLSIGQGVHIGRECEIAHGSAIQIGDSTSIQDRCIIHGNVYIGRYCSFSLNVFVSAGTHCFDLHPEMFIKDQDLIWISRPNLVKRYSRPIRIEDDCWIGINSVISPGTTIGKGVIVGANSVVTHDVPPYTVVAGAPAKVIKRRLQFVRPRKASCSSVQDLPYFYSGFALSIKELETVPRDGGIYAGRRFSLMLDTSGATSVLMEIRALVVTRCVLHFGDQKIEIGLDMRTARFSIDDGSRQLEFTVSTNAPDRWVVCVASVQLE